jgi:hypothetical protein
MFYFQDSQEQLPRIEICQILNRFQLLIYFDNEFIKLFVMMEKLNIILQIEKASIIA